MVIFKPLSRKSIRKIIDKEIEKTSKLLQGQKISLVVSKEARTYLLKEGFSEEYGARPLRRLIQKVIENPISNMIVNSKLGKNDIVNVEVEEGKIKVGALENAITKSQG